MTVKPHEPAPRALPTVALLTLGRYGREPGFISFVSQAAEAGFGISQPGDHDLPDGRWDEVATLRVNALVGAWKRASDQASGTEAS